MYMRFKEGKEKTVTLSYDDAMTSDIRLIEIMNKYGLKGTFNINSGWYYIGEGEEETCRRLKLSEAKKLYIGSGHEVAVHSLSHLSLDCVRNEDVINEIIEDRKSLESEFEVIVKGMAYPMGTYNDVIIDILRHCGISYARTTKETEKFSLPDNWLEWHPTCHHNNRNLMELAQTFLLETTWSGNSIFYLWGHSEELYKDKNWEIIEEFAKFIGGHDKIWYATNIEIYNYVKAYDALETSFDNRIIHNPSSIDVWVNIDSETIKIDAGKTAHIK